MGALCSAQQDYAPGQTPPLMQAPPASADHRATSLLVHRKSCRQSTITRGGRALLGQPVLIGRNTDQERLMENQLTYACPPIRTMARVPLQYCC